MRCTITKSKVEADRQDLLLHCFSGLLVSKFAFSLRRVDENTVIRTITVFPEDQIRRPSLASAVVAAPCLQSRSTDRKSSLQPDQRICKPRQNRMKAESLTAMSVPPWPSRVWMRSA
jgi:hypothetical protein